MASHQQITANQENAKSSTGPRSKKGRDASSKNARRHGLAIAIGSDPAVQQDIETLAGVLAPCGLGISHAREAAEAALDLVRIRKVRASLFEALYFSRPNTPCGLTELDNQLGKLERYERRAFSRRNSALRAIFN
jgi:hypothetical protein